MCTITMRTASGLNTGCSAITACLLIVICRSYLHLQLLALSMCRGVLARELAAGSNWWRFIGAMLLPVIPLHPNSAAAPASKQAVSSSPLLQPTALALRKVQTGMLKLLAFSCITVAGVQAYMQLHGGSSNGSSDSSMTDSDSDDTIYKAAPAAGVVASILKLLTALFSSSVITRAVSVPLLCHLGGEEHYA